MSSTETKLITRVVSLPILACYDAQDYEMTGEVEPVGILEAFRPAWRLATDLANWAQFHLVCRDEIRTPDMERLPKYDREAMFGSHPRRFARKASATKEAQKVGDPQISSLYDLWTREYPARQAWDGSAVNARDVLKAVEDTWKNHKSFGRLAVLWKGQARPMTFRFPYPWPVPADRGKTLRLSRDKDGRPIISMPFLNPHDRLTLRLADGREFRRQLRQFDKLMSCPERLGQAKICGRLRNGGLVGADLRLVGRFDASTCPGELSAVCRTGSNKLIRCAIKGDEGRFYEYCGDEMPGIVALYDDWRHRFSIDNKHEKRWPSHVLQRRINGPQVNAKQERATNRLRTAKQTAAHQLVQWLIRQGVNDLTYDDSDKSFLPRFDWSGLREVIRCKCEQASISFQHQAGADDDK
jgi:hypothetical protein